MAFEPLPDYFSKLKEEYGNRADVRDTALSDSEGVATFYSVEGLEAMSGLKKQRYPSSGIVKEIKVKTASLDSLLNPERTVNFIKIDVEGAELNVLRGARSTILRFHPVILFEFAKLHVQEYGVTPEKIYDFFTLDLKYSIFRLDRGERFTRERFIQNAYDSDVTNYNRFAETNFLAFAE